LSRPEYSEPYFAITIGGTVLIDAELARISGDIQITLDAENDDQASFSFDEMIDFHFQTAYRENMNVEIEYGHLRGERAFYRGEITAVQPDFPESGVPVIAYECSSKAKQGHERQKSRTFKDVKYSDVAAMVAKEHSWETDIVATIEVVRQITQAGESDIQFLRRLAAKINYITKMVGSTLYFGPQPIAGKESGSFDYRTGNFLVKSFKPKFETQDKGKRVSASNINEKEQQQVTARAWGTKEKLGLTGGTELIATSNAGDVAALWASQGTGNPTAPVARRPNEPTASSKPAPINRQQAFVDLEKGRSKTGVESTITSVIEGIPYLSLATGGTGKGTMHFLRDTGDGGSLPDNAADMEKAVSAKQRKNEKVVGGTLVLAVCKPGLKGNDKVVVTGVGPRFSGTYFVEKATHVVGMNGALTTVEVSRNALGNKKVDKKKDSAAVVEKRKWETADKLGLTNR
jgi:hypothetical protein